MNKGRQISDNKKKKKHQTITIENKNATRTMLRQNVTIEDLLLKVSFYYTSENIIQ